MPVLIAKLGEHRNEDATRNLICYMMKSGYAAYCGGSGIIADNSESIIRSMEFTKKMYGEEDRKQICHLIIGSKNEGLIGDELLQIAHAASCYFYTRGFQSFYVLHRGSDEDPNYMHVHLAVNTVNFRNGNRLYETYANTTDLRNVLESCFPNFKWRSVNDWGKTWED